MNKMATNLLVSVLVLSILGCATNKRAEEAAEFAKNQQPKSGDSVLIVPIGQAVPEFSGSDAMGMLSGPVAFGLLGLLVGAAIDSAISNSDSVKAEASQVSAAFIDLKTEEYLAKKVAENLQSCGVASKVHTEILLQEPIPWDTKTAPVISTTDPSLKGTKYFVETGVSSISVKGGFRDPIVCISTKGFLYNTETRKLVNKLWSENYFDVVGCSEVEKSEVGSQARFDALISATKKTLDSTVIQLSSALCKSAGNN